MKQFVNGKTEVGGEVSPHSQGQGQPFPVEMTQLQRTERKIGHFVRGL